MKDLRISTSVRQTIGTRNRRLKGIAGGGSGECQLPDGKTILANPPEQNLIGPGIPIELPNAVA
jgi:hypothetical protein